MSSQKLIFFFLIGASVIGLIFIFVRRFSEASCPQNDTRICQFIKNNRQINQREIKGTYESNQSDVSAIVRWQKNKEFSTFSIEKDENEILNAIMTSRYIYIKDYADNLWWREQKSVVENSLRELPFNPELFFNSLETIIKNENTTYTFIENIQCGGEECFRYRITYPEQNEEEQLFIYFSTANFYLKQVFLVKDTGPGELQILYEDVSVVEPKDIKVVSSGRNIFMEYIELRDTETPKNYEYLQEFQRQRMQSEGSTTIPYVEEVATDESEIPL